MSEQKNTEGPKNTKHPPFSLAEGGCFLIYQTYSYNPQIKR